MSRFRRSEGVYTNMSASLLDAPPNTHGVKRLVWCCSTVAVRAEDGRWAPRHD
ncbi:hypothetical protein IG631_23519 [Alternaria alternata]|nr:hypothetical protein IG631_23519 [Alternaria alternata]